VPAISIISRITSGRRLSAFLVNLYKSPFKKQRLALHEENIDNNGENQYKQQRSQSAHDDFEVYAGQYNQGDRNQRDGGYRNNRLGSQHHYKVNYKYYQLYPRIGFVKKRVPREKLSERYIFKHFSVNRFPF
jgi:hypothetical protein